MGTTTRTVTYEQQLAMPEAQTVEAPLLDQRKLRTSRVVAQGSLSPKCFRGVAVVVSSIWPD